MVHALPPDCLLRRAGAADVAAYADFSRRSFIDTYGSSHAADALARHVAARMADAVLRNELSDPMRTVLAVTVDGAWVACALLRAGSESPGVRGALPVEIERFYVDRRWHGRGLASPLMAAALEAAREAGGDVAWLAVWSQNSRALRFYEKEGFRAVGRAVYLFDGEPEDDPVLVLPLSL